MSHILQRWIAQKKGRIFPLDLATLSFFADPRFAPSAPIFILTERDPVEQLDRRKPLQLEPRWRMKLS
ncbi:hypothetical protein NL676_036660 [Syzygium grande]|nr:hypothetical protein NL676_036660 [Syzygium grande]